MRLKTFSAATMSQAMRLVREELGEDAIIVSTRRGPNGKGVRITAAVEQTALKEELPGSPAAAIAGKTKGSPLEQMAGTLRTLLKEQGVPERIITRLISAASILGVDDPAMALAGALDEVFRFSPIKENECTKPLMLIGPPGSGKTILVAKLAARAKLRHCPVQVITTDTKRPGGVEQLSAFIKILGIPLHCAQSESALRDIIGDCHAGDFILIDSGNINPFENDDLAETARLIHAASAEPILVLPAGLDVGESAEMAEAFGALGVKRMLVTRLDLTRRLGSLLAAAEAGRMKFSDVSITPGVAEGLNAINPVSLARLLIPAEQDIPLKTEARS